MDMFPNSMKIPVQNPRRTSMIGPVQVAVLTEAAALQRVDDMIDAGGERLVTFCNAHSINLARENRELRDAYARSLVLNDGVGVDLARWWLEGEPFPANLAGTDFVTRLLRSRRDPLKLYLLGSKPGVAALAADQLATIAPQHHVVGIRDGYFSPVQTDEVVADIVCKSPDIILVGMGQPRQEIWAIRNAAKTGALVICVGAYLDFIAGVFPRAPGFMRAVRAEWVYRLILEPRRLFHRYMIGNPKFFLGILRDRYRRNRSKSRIKQPS